MKKGRILLAGIIVMCCGCAHRYGIINPNVYVREQVAGTMQVSDEGRPLSNPVSKVYLIYVETAAENSLPQLQNAWIDGKAFSIRPVAIKQDSVLLGLDSNNNTVVVKPARNHQLWQLVLVPNTNEAPNATVEKAMQQAPVVLTGLWKQDSFAYKIKKVQPVESAIYP